MFTPSLRHDDVTLSLTRGYIVWPIEMDSARDFAAERAGEQGPSFRIPVKFHPSKSFAFPARKFGSNGAEKRSFRAEWCAKYDWLHYDRVADAAFCHLCITAEHEKKFLVSTKRDPAFISRGYTNWKDATTAFSTHLASRCHKEAVEAKELPKQTGDVGEKLSTEHEQQKAENRAMFRRILQNVRFLARQGLSLRGHGDGSDSNFTQLLRLRAFDSPAVLTWMEKKTDKYMSSDIQNECLQIMALSILRQISASFVRNGFFTVMADECTDIANKEQFVVCIRWVDETLTDHEDVIGVYNVGTIDANTLTAAIHDVLLRMSLKMSQCRGQCYDGASNMAGSKHGVAAQLLAEEPRALLTHCYGHALNLVVADAMKQSKVCSDGLDTAFEVSKLIRFSLKRNAAFDRIKVENPAEESGPSHSIQSFCPTRWTVRGDAIESIIDNFDTLKKLWEECLETKLDPDVKGRIIGVQTQMLHYNTLFGLLLSKKILKITDNLSRTLQKQAMSAAEGQTVTELTVRTLKVMRTEESFTLFFDLVDRFRELTGTDLPVLPRKRRAPQRYEVGSAEGSHSITVEDHYRRQDYEVQDIAIASITNRFDQPGYVMYKKLEGLLVSAANGQVYDQYFETVTTFYKDDFDRALLSAQLQNFGTCFAEKPEIVSLGECVAFLRGLSQAQKSFFSDVCRLAHLILVMPAIRTLSVSTAFQL